MMRCDRPDAVANGKDVSKVTVRDVMTIGMTYCQDTGDVNDAVRTIGSKQIRSSFR